MRLSYSAGFIRLLASDRLLFSLTSSFKRNWVIVWASGVAVAVSVGDGGTREKVGGTSVGLVVGNDEKTGRVTVCRADSVLGGRVGWLSSEGLGVAGLHAERTPTVRANSMGLSFRS